MARGRNGNTESVDNYLKAILVLEEVLPEAEGNKGVRKEGVAAARVTVKALATELRVAPASVTNMLQKLAAAASPMVEYERHRGVGLSRAGRRRALEVVRHHRLIETFLYEVLDYPLDEVHEEAERLEHFISERFEERIAAKLGHPKTDPHGHAIPAMDGRMAARESMTLAEVAGGGTFLVESVSDRDARRLRKMEVRGVGPGARIEVKLRAGAEGFRVRAGGAGKAFDLTLEAARDVRIVRPASKRTKK
ncbi:MAG TPA: metal-dependent transcriptional regulator [Acidobacteriaceae bacterium]|nr:metal-dependent transcriptional regulator [Acidobacteriaceae bacterium]